MDPRYQSPTAPVEDIEVSEFRDLGKLTTTLRWLLWSGVVVSLVSLLSSALQLELLSRSFTQEEATANDEREAFVGVLSLVLTLTTFIVFGRWILQAHRNLPALGARSVDFTPGWALGWFFIPIANLWKPYQAMKSLWHHSENAVSPPVLRTPGILVGWWTLWIISAFLGNIEMRMTLSAQGLDELVAVTQITIASCILNTALCAVAAVMVVSIWKAQLRQHENPVEAPPRGFAEPMSGPA